MAAPTSAQYSLTIRIELEHRPGALGEVLTAIGSAGGQLGAIDLIEADDRRTLRDITLDARDQGH